MQIKTIYKINGKVFVSKHLILNQAEMAQKSREQCISQMRHDDDSYDSERLRGGGAWWHFG